MFEFAWVCLATAIYFESRGEPVTGQIAVGQSVFYRSIQFDPPKPLCDVVTQGGFREKYGCHYSFYCDGKPERVNDDWAYGKALLLGALAVILPPVVGGATHYHTKDVSPWWAPELEYLGTISEHRFYKEFDSVSSD